MLIISGTNRSNSKSLRISKLYQNILAQMGQESEIIDLSTLPKDFAFSALYENGGKNESFNVFRDKVYAEKKFIFVVAEYNGSFPGVLKAFIDGLKYPDSFQNKKCALVGISSGVMGGALALSHLSDILAYLSMNVMGTRVKLPQIEQNLVENEISNPKLNELINIQIRDFINF